MGRAYDSSVDLTKALKNHYNPSLALERIKQTHEWLKDETPKTPEELEELDALALGCCVRRRERERDERVRGGDCGGRPKVGNSKFRPKRPPSLKNFMMQTRR